MTQADNKKLLKQIAEWLDPGLPRPVEVMLLHLDSLKRVDGFLHSWPAKDGKLALEDAFKLGRLYEAERLKEEMK